MSRTLLAVLSVLAGVVVSSSLAQSPGAPASGAPTLVCDAPEFDFGEKDNATTVDHAFVLRNAGGAALTIREVRPSCGCTVAQLSSKVIPPQGEVTLSTKLDLRGRQGLQTKSILIISDDPARPNFNVWLKGTAIPELALDPAFVNFGDVLETNVVSREVRLASRQRGVTIEQLSSDTPRLAVEPWPAGDPRGTGFDVRTVPPLPGGYLRGSITVKTSHAERPELALSVFANVQGDVTVMPREILLRESMAGPVTRAVLVRGGLVKDYRILGVEPPVKGLNVSWQQYGPGMYRVDVRDMTVGPELDGKVLTIRTDLPKNPVILVPIRVLP